MTLQLREGTWHPEGERVRGVPIFAFAEDDGVPHIPGPMIRVDAGAEVRVTLRNTLRKRAVVHGLHDHDGRADSVVLGAGETREVRFRATTVGTHFYWARTTVSARPIGTGEDSQLVGAFVVDDPSHPRAADRVLVISVFDDTVPAPRFPAGHLQVFALNGRSWPRTERYDYALGDTVRWRLINGSNHVHPMHLHGHFFTVGSKGTAWSDTVYAPAQRRQAVTEFLLNATSTQITWVADRPGNWLFHCHMISHMDVTLRLDSAAAMGTHSAHGRLEDSMAGLVAAITIRDRRPSAARAARASAPNAAVARRRVFVTERAVAAGVSAMSYVLQEGDGEPAADSVRLPGSTLVLHQGEPTAITVINRAREATAVHWHGLELDSYYDGVAGWSGADSRTAPMIAPGDSFVVRLTPTRAGTFIYHTHQGEGTQLRAGLYGALLVLPPGEARDTTERLVMLTDPPPGAPANAPTGAVGGSLTPAPIELRAGVAHRLRFISIGATLPKRITLREDSTVVTWRVIAKDGATVADSQRDERSATMPFGVGETVDVELRRDRPGTLTLDILTNGKDLMHVPVIVR
ncbi:MAG: multicopper oxidase domain-containing protein [Gemmatimonadetes bacterium]|nr:multicopper oxidase domain-containing protein [Gemmatimonadota bacterium]